MYYDVIVLSGGFDPMHVGHLRLIQESAKMAETFDGALSMIGEKFFTFQKIVIDEGPFDILKGTLSELFLAWTTTAISFKDFIFYHYLLYSHCSITY